MKILYVGGVYHVEYSLWHEQNNNPNIKVHYLNYCRNKNSKVVKYSNADYDKIVPSFLASQRQHVDDVIKQLNPDMVIFRNFLPSEYWVNMNEILWVQELNPTTETGYRKHRIEGNGTNKKCYGSHETALKNNGYFMPYCVSKHCEKPSNNKTMSVFLATIVPPRNIVGSNKSKSLDILLMPLLEKIPGHVFFHLIDMDGYGNANPLIKKYVKPPINVLTTVQNMSQSKIYLSPTSIWHDEGWISHKTIQAMACGCLVVTNKYPGIERLIGKDGENLIYSNDPKETIDKVQYYLAHENERAAIAMRGYSFVHSEYNWQKRLDGMKEFFYGNH